LVVQLAKLATVLTAMGGGNIAGKIIAGDVAGDLGQAALQARSQKKAAAATAASMANAILLGGDKGHSADPPLNPALLRQASAFAAPAASAAAPAVTMLGRFKGLLKSVLGFAQSLVTVLTKLTKMTFVTVALAALANAIIGFGRSFGIGKQEMSSFIGHFIDI